MNVPRLLLLPKQNLLSIIPILQAQMPIIRGIGLGNGPRLIERPNDLLGKGSFFKMPNVVLQLLETAHADNHTVVPALGGVDFELTVMHDPSHGRLDEGQTGLVHRVLDDLQRSEGGVFEIAIAIHLAHAGRLVTESPRGGNHIFCLDLSGQETAGERVVHDDVETVTAAGGDQLGLDGARDGVVHCLEDRRADKVVLVAGQDDLGYFVRGEVADSESHEFPGFVQVVYCAEGLEEGGSSILFNWV